MWWGGGEMAAEPQCWKARLGDGDAGGAGWMVGVMVSAVVVLMASVGWQRRLDGWGGSVVMRMAAGGDDNEGVDDDDDDMMMRVVLG
ncbi:hypothetical protein Tco_1121239 [Tanacetum coccineum]|uniref:Uncharacterized protein n=1 Tax=Tanacetum coccineum TaxID=301880 RepID=A0ABQ5IX45_9ASTR